MRLLHLETVDSTNTYALRHFSEVADTTLVAAAEQTAGRGRLGRRWVAPPGRNLTALERVSFLGLTGRRASNHVSTEMCNRVTSNCRRPRGQILYQLGYFLLKKKKKKLHKE